ncbi:MAG TPA: sulfurtransferase, partial [Flavobacterium sp.]|nr:sulfurtransferase [Flavobacterium sp.]
MIKVEGTRRTVQHLEGGIIHYANTAKERSLPNKFIGKNFVFDHRLGERITDDIVSQCHQCGKPCDDHTNCANEGCHLLFIQCEDCKVAMEGCCSTECLDIIHLPEDQQKALRRGIMNGNKIFKKGKSDKLTYKHVTDGAVGKAAPKPAPAKPERANREYLGKAVHFYPKASVADFQLENGKLSVGDTIWIKGPTTGEQQLTLTDLYVDNAPAQSAAAGSLISIKVPFRTRLADKIYR